MYIEGKALKNPYIHKKKIIHFSNWKLIRKKSWSESQQCGKKQCEMQYKMLHNMCVKKMNSKQWVTHKKKKNIITIIESAGIFKIENFM